MCVLYKCTDNMYYVSQQYALHNFNLNAGKKWSLILLVFELLLFSYLYFILGDSGSNAGYIHLDRFCQQLILYLWFLELFLCS